MKNTQPHLTIDPSQADRMIDLLAWMLLASIWVIAFYGMATLPGTIPTHFNFKGEADGWGSPAFLLFMPALVTLLTPLLTWINRRPHTFNYPVKITPENALRQYTNATRLVRMVKLSIGIVFTGIELMMWLSAANIVKPQIVWLVPAILMLVYTPLAIYMYRSLKMK